MSGWASRWTRKLAFLNYTDRGETGFWHIWVAALEKTKFDYWLAFHLTRRWALAFFILIKNDEVDVEDWIVLFFYFIFFRVLHLQIELALLRLTTAGPQQYTSALLRTYRSSRASRIYITIPSTAIVNHRVVLSNFFLRKGGSEWVLGSATLRWETFGCQN
jgi:hypothetical protein